MYANEDVQEYIRAAAHICPHKITLAQAHAQPSLHCQNNCIALGTITVDTCGGQLITDVLLSIIEFTRKSDDDA